ncbi:E domain-containing protein, partial [Staphylococcus aureus]|uniref:E domain-containing protein n=1 Tax=Staphylococcus aureus TaxID=1280 RepID=UPI00215ABB92
KGLPTVKVLQLIAKIYGAEKRVEWVNQLVSNSFNKKIRPLRTQSDWISSNPTEVDNFIKDPYSGFNVSNQLLYQTEKVPGKPGIKNPDTGKVIEEPVDDVIRHGPKTGTPETKT